MVITVFNSLIRLACFSVLILSVVNPVVGNTCSIPRCSASLTSRHFLRVNGRLTRRINRITDRLNNRLRSMYSDHDHRHELGAE
ncbi:MAG: hypothetical protein [Circular genetic element sp.]|nr:MAG: hypothetical protein [Circular genetic element sp.]